MTRKISNICIIIGTVLIISALAIAAWNNAENQRAQFYATKTVKKLINEIGNKKEENDIVSHSNNLVSLPDPYDTEMTEIEIDGIKYIGYISIPDYKLELPVTSDWNYEYLKNSPCRYYGSTKTDNLILAAHNYRSHFGYIKRLMPGDDVVFTDMDGITTHYKVVDTEVLNPTAIEDMKSGGYALTLFTCTYGGKSRVAVRCDIQK